MFYWLLYWDFLSRDNFFDILLVFAYFLQTYCDIYSFHILSFYFFLLQLSFCIYFLPVRLISLYHFYNNLLLYLVPNLCFFDNKLNQHPLTTLLISLIWSLIPFQTSLYIFSNSLFSFVESKTKDLFTPFSSIYPFAWAISKHKGFTL